MNDDDDVCASINIRSLSPVLPFHSLHIYFNDAFYRVYFPCRLVKWIIFFFSVSLTPHRYDFHSQSTKKLVNCVIWIFSFHIRRENIFHQFLVAFHLAYGCSLYKAAWKMYANWKNIYFQWYREANNDFEREASVFVCHQEAYHQYHAIASTPSWRKRNGKKKKVLFIRVFLHLMTIIW